MASLFLYLATFLSLCSALSLPTNLHARQAPTLKTGSWYITYQPNAPNSQLYKGPMRVTSTAEEMFVSGDLYNGTVAANPADGSPILPRANYWAFVRTTKLTAGSNGGFTFNLEYWRFLRFRPGARYIDTVWGDQPEDGGYIVDLSPAQAPSGYPDSQNYFTGDVKIASSGAVVGKFTMGWVSDILRRIKLEIGTVSGLELPLTDSSGTRGWKQIFSEVGWDIDVKIGKTDIPEPSNPAGPGYFSNEQQHQAMIQYRTPTDLDKEWKYYLLVVRRMEGVARGAMIDESIQYNNVPREGTCIASEWIVGTNWDGTPDNQFAWPESVRGKKFVELHDAWYRTAVHEVGHFFNLPHPYDFVDSAMTDTSSYVDAGEEGVTPKKFPENIGVESFDYDAPGDVFKMQHRPDTHVRPGYFDFGAPAKDNEPPVVVNLKG